MSTVYAFYVCGYHPIAPLRVLTSKSEQVPRIEIAVRPFAFDRIGRIPSLGIHKVNLMFVLVAPVVDFACLQMSMKLIEYEMLPQGAEILQPKAS